MLYTIHFLLQQLDLFEYLHLLCTFAFVLLQILFLNIHLVYQIYLYY
ncbi:379L [Invertebrate iridescent virus Kaz2018]|uniref:379L n=1 Tax=Invertebrate iridescent virus 6 TaxID=176652 RepID=Q91FE5_IIV6|nr:379L [Invertebrate iridescent virus 6]AAK82239.1 379L [Invertebrate iridescent virus 6]QMS79762.1 hypothetical protein IIV6-T1_372 [Invertebrate iridescent virus 6]QNH08789.1 379L [Invertebrate iridescent virus Kaz2018]